MHLLQETDGRIVYKKQIDTYIETSVVDPDPDSGGSLDPDPDSGGPLDPVPDSNVLFLELKTSPVAWMPLWRPRIK